MDLSVIFFGLSSADKLLNKSIENSVLKASIPANQIKLSSADKLLNKSIEHNVSKVSIPANQIKLSSADFNFWTNQ